MSLMLAVVEHHPFCAQRNDDHVAELLSKPSKARQPVGRDIGFARDLHGEPFGANQVPDLASKRGGPLAERASVEDRDCRGECLQGRQGSFQLVPVEEKELRV